MTVPEIRRKEYPSAPFAIIVMDLVSFLLENSLQLVIVPFRWYQIRSAPVGKFVINHPIYIKEEK